MNRYEKYLATQDEPGSIYSYAYGVLSEKYRQFHMGNTTLDQYVKGVQELISAVDFRTAEIVALNMLDRGIAVLTQSESGQELQVRMPTAIYAVPSDADGIARDQ